MIKSITDDGQFIKLYVKRCLGQPGNGSCYNCLHYKFSDFHIIKEQAVKSWCLSLIPWPKPSLPAFCVCSLITGISTNKRWPYFDCFQKWCTMTEKSVYIIFLFHILTSCRLQRTHDLASYMFRSTHFVHCQQVRAVRYRGQKKTSFSQKFSAWHPQMTPQTDSVNEDSSCCNEVLCCKPNLFYWSYTSNNKSISITPVTWRCKQSHLPKFCVHQTCLAEWIISNILLG
jgi:hypothetical protein